MKHTLDDPQGIYDSMTDKQKNFCREYIVDFNASAAIIRAGYDSAHPHKFGSEMLQKPPVRAVIDYLLAERAKEVTVSADYVLRKIVRTLEKADEKDNYTAVLRAAELLAKHLGMFVERTEISGPDGEAIRMKQEVQQNAADFARSISQVASRGGERSNSLFTPRRDSSGS